jgi:2-isopropylmalate synthase
MKKHVTVFDTTLRDGEQAPGIALNPDQKLRIALQLELLGVDVVEAGFPVSSEGDFEAVQRIARQLNAPVVAAMARTSPTDVDGAWAAIKDANRPRFHIFLATSQLHMEHKLRMSEEEVLTAVKTGVGRAREYTEDVEYTAEDATRSDPDFLMRVLTTAVDAGATTINVPDTVGYATPGDYGALVRRVVTEVKGSNNQVTVSTHCHNDLGLAVANSLAAVEAGAGQVEATINGIGERAGNASLEELVMALKVRSDVFGVDTGGGQECLRPRVGDPPARCASQPIHLRDHGSGVCRPLREVDCHGEALGQSSPQALAGDDGSRPHPNCVGEGFPQYEEGSGRPG